MSQLYIVFFKMAVAVAAGFFLARKKVIGDLGRRTLIDLLLNAVLPFTILSSSQYAYSYNMLRSIIAVGAGAVLYYFITLIAMRLIMSRVKMIDSDKRVFIATSVFGNCSFVGMPVMYSLFGDAGLLLSAIYNLVYNLCFYTYGVHLLSGKKPSFMEYINPISISSAVSVILFVIPWRAPLAVTDAVNLVGDMTFPLSTIIMGLSLATVDFKKLFVDIRSYIVCLLRLIAFPVIMTAMIIFIKQFTAVLPATAITLILMTALPSGTMNVILSERFNCSPRFCARTVTLSLLLMVLTMPVMIALCMGAFLAG